MAYGRNNLSRFFSGLDTSGYLLTQKSLVELNLLRKWLDPRWGRGMGSF